MEAPSCIQKPFVLDHSRHLLVPRFSLLNPASYKPRSLPSVCPPIAIGFNFIEMTDNMYSPVSPLSLSLSLSFPTGRC
jgi:hypothetical protein